MSVAAIRVAALTGLRIGEILNIRWEDVDFSTGRLVLPDTKTGRRIANLPSPALAIVKELPRSSEWVFTGRGSSAISYHTVRIRWVEIAAAAGFRGIKSLSGVTLHDLRRSYMTNAARSGIGVMVLRDLLGHKSSKVAERYVRELGEPVREARSVVADKIAAMMEGESG